ncbi:MAG: hypothetical protein ACYCPO_13110 [Acidobacteriaceae bacterium]
MARGLRAIRAGPPGSGGFDFDANAMKKIARKTMAECKAMPGRKRELAKFAAMPDSEIDFSELPELTETFWQNAVPNPFYRPVKK